MKEIEKAGKNATIIHDIKRYSQLKAFYWRIDNDYLTRMIMVTLSESFYPRHGIKGSVKFFYEYWFIDKHYYDVKDLKG